MTGYIYQVTYVDSLSVPHTALIYSENGFTVGPGGTLTTSGTFYYTDAAPTNTGVIGIVTNPGPLQITINAPVASIGSLPPGMTDGNTSTWQTVPADDASALWATINSNAAQMAGTTWTSGTEVVSGDANYDLHYANCGTFANTLLDEAGINEPGVNPNIYPGITPLGSQDLIGNASGGTYTVFSGNTSTFIDVGGNNTINVQEGGFVNIHPYQPSNNSDATTSGSDTINLQGGYTSSNVSFDRQGNDLLIDDSSGNVIAAVENYFGNENPRTYGLTFNGVADPTIPIGDPSSMASAYGLNSPLFDLANFVSSTLEGLFNIAQAVYSPLVLDLSSGGTGLTLCSSSSSGAVYWDFGSGFKNASGWVTGTTGLLCVDPTDTGVIKQADLFGNNGGSANGFQSLAAYDTNSDGVINSSDTDFGALRVWIPSAGSNGVSQPGDLYTLASLGITSISLDYASESYQINGNSIEEQSTFVINGNTQTIADAWFAYDPVNTVYDGSYTLNPDVLFLPDQRGYGELPELAISMSLNSTLLTDVYNLTLQSFPQLLDPSFHLEATLQTILFEWAGVTGVGANADASYFNTALQQQELSFVEQLLGQPWHDGSGDVNSAYAADYLASSWNVAFSYVAAHVLGQAGFGSLMQNADYDIASDTFTLGGSIYDVAVQFADQALPGQPLEHLATNDIFVLEPGDAPLSGGSPTLLISETASGGGTNSVLIGAAAVDATMWDDHFGNVYLQYSSTDVVEITAAVDTNGATVVDQYIQQVIFEDGTMWNLADGLNLTAANDYQALYGSSTGGDTLTATGAYNTLNAFGGTETLVADGTATTINNGTGTDTDVFSAGAAPISSGGDVVYANTSGGTGIINLHGIDPSAVTMWDNYSGDVMIKFSSTDEIIIHGGSFSWTTGLTLNGLNEVTFDSSYATTWNLATGLHLTAPSDYQLLFGTASGGDTLTAGGTGDNIYAFGGTDTLVGGPGANLYNGTGNDTDVIDAGSSPSSNPVTINANASGGSDNVILLHDVVASDIAMWDTSSGNLIINTPSDQVVVSGGSFSWTTGFAVGNIDHIALDSGSPISLTGGLNLTAINDSQSLYGTGHGDNLTAAGNYDNLYGIAGNNTMTGDSGTTYFTGGSGNDTMVAGSGTNYMTMGTGADEIKIESASSSTTVSGFSVSNGDTIHVEDVISSYDPVHDAIANFVQETTSGGNTQFSVDPTGAGSFTVGPVLTLSGVTGLDDVATLVAHGTLVVHA